MLIGNRRRAWLRPRETIYRSRALRRFERPVMAKDRLLEPLQRLARLDAEVVHERMPRLCICLERLRLPVGTVERKHLLRA
jgi:hypothetical protein